MPHINPTWQMAVLVAGTLLLLAALCRARRARRAAAGLGEAALVVAMFAAWQLIGELTHREVAGATSNALAVQRTEGWLHLPTELGLQQALLTHHTWSQLANGYYLYGHFNPVVVVLAWAWWRHRHAYPQVRLELVLLTAAAFVVHAVPVAPPRLLPQLGFHDLALQYGQSVYGSFGAGIPGQLLAMPSLHVGWAVLCARTVLRLSSSRWRFAALAHPVLMTYVVVVTGNHWWLDGLVSCALLALAVPLAWAALTGWARCRPPTPRDRVDGLAAARPDGPPQRHHAGAVRQR